MLSVVTVFTQRFVFLAGMSLLISNQGLVDYDALRKDEAYSRGGSGSGHCMTSTLPSGVRASTGAYSPISFRFHHIPVARFSARVVNQYCQSMARTCCGGPCGNGISCEQRQHIRRASQQSLFGAGYDQVLAPRAQRREPQVPIEARLIGRINTGSLTRVLRLIAEGICHPGLPVIRALELDLPAAARHHRKQPVAIGDAKRLERGDWRARQR